MLILHQNQHYEYKIAVIKNNIDNIIILKFFMKVNIALLTVTDTRTIDNDKSGSILVEKIKEANHNLIDRKICKDNKDEIVFILKEWLKNEKIDVVITTGGTGLTGRDITPEALDEIADKHIPGFGEIFRNISLKTVGLQLFNQELVQYYRMENTFLPYQVHLAVFQMHGKEF